MLRLLKHLPVNLININVVKGMIYCKLEKKKNHINKTLNTNQQRHKQTKMSYLFIDFHLIALIACKGCDLRPFSFYVMWLMKMRTEK